MRDAIKLLGDGDWEHDHIWRIHRDLVPNEPAGYRTSQVWVGGTTPLTAQYAGPPHEVVRGLMDDLSPRMTPEPLRKPCPDEGAELCGS